MGLKDGRSRNWTFVGYPDDSLPDNYKEILCDELRLVWVESPIHSNDVNPDGTLKKPHIHFVVTFEGNKSFNQIKEITDRLHCPIPQQVANLNGMIRYLIHMDNPEKYQYKREDVKAYGGFDLPAYFAPTASQYQAMVIDLLAFVDDNSIYEFNHLVRLCREAGKSDWLYILTSRNTIFFVHYLKSRKFENKLYK